MIRLGVGGAGPAGSPVAEPVEDHLAGEVVQRPGAAGDGQPPVAEADVVELEFADRLGPGGVDGGQCQDEPVPGDSGRP
jgi:hypothetical protein